MVQTIKNGWFMTLLYPHYGCISSITHIAIPTLLPIKVIYECYLSTNTAFSTAPTSTRCSSALICRCFPRSTWTPRREQRERDVRDTGEPWRASPWKNGDVIVVYIYIYIHIHTYIYIYTYTFLFNYLFA